MGTMDTIMSKEDPILQSPPPSSTSVNKTPPFKIPKYTSSNTPKTARRKKETLLKEASTFCSKGCSEWKLKRSESAMEAFASALMILETVLGTFHLLTAKTYFWIGFILQKSSGEKTNEDYRRCLEAFSMAFRIRLRLCGSKHKSTEEARQALRWAFRKISESNGDDYESIQDFLLTAEKSLRYEVQGDKKIVAADYPPALTCFEKAFQMAEQWGKYARPTPQLMKKLGDCYSSLGENQNAIFWFRRALLEIYAGAFHREKHPVVEMVYEQLKKLVPAESTNEYIQMVASSMQHVNSSQETTGWKSQEELLKAIQLELLYANSKHPFVKFLLDKIDLSVVQGELNIQVQVVEHEILQLALSFHRKDTEKSKILEQLDAFQKRANSCLEIVGECMDTSTALSNHPLAETWNGQEGRWLSRQVQAIELLQLRVSDLHGKRLKRSTKKQSKRVDSLKQDLDRLSNDLIDIQNQLNASPSKLQRGDRESLISQMADAQQEIAFREGQLELEQQSSEEESLSSDDSGVPCQSLVTLEMCLGEAKQDHDRFSHVHQPGIYPKDETNVDKSSFWNDSFEAGLWKYPGGSIQEAQKDTKEASAETKEAQHITRAMVDNDLMATRQPLTIPAEEQDNFAAFVSPKAMDTTGDTSSRQIELDNALREAEDLREQKERNGIELENAKSALESCQRMLDQSNSALGTEKSFLIQNLFAASSQEVEHYSRKNADIDEKLHAVQVQIEEMQREVQTTGEPSHATLQQGRDAVNSDSQEEEVVECTQNHAPIHSSENARGVTAEITANQSSAIVEVEGQGVLSHAPSLHKSLASAIQHLDASMDRKVQESFQGIDAFLLNPNTATSAELSSAMETVRKQALGRLDGCYGEMKKDRSHYSSTREKTPLRPLTPSERVARNKLKEVSSNGVVSMETIQKRIRRHKFTYYSSSGKFTMRRPSIDVDKWGNGIPVSKEYNPNMICAETIDVMVFIAYDKSTLLLSRNSMVQHREKDGVWKILGPLDQREVPFGWIQYAKGKGRRQSSYSLDEILEEAIIFRSRYCDSIVNPNLSLFDIMLCNGLIRICMILFVALILPIVIFKGEECISPFLAL